MSFESDQRHPFLDRPQDRRVVGSGGCDVFAVGRERYAVNAIRMDKIIGIIVSEVRIPDPGGVVIAACDDLLTVWRESGGENRARMADEAADLLACLHIP